MQKQSFTPVEMRQVPQSVKEAQHELIAYVVNQDSSCVHFTIKDVKAGDYPIGNWEIIVQRIK